MKYEKVNDESKLPKWARERIEDLKREREIAVRALNNCLDQQTQSPFYTQDMLCLGERIGPSLKKQYIQAYNMNVDFEGVSLRINTVEGRGIRLQWSIQNGIGTGDVAFIPESYQCARLITSENMRK